MSVTKADHQQRPLARALATALPGAALLAMGLLLTPAAMAATFQVTNTAETGPGSLRQAILDTNASAGADVIQFAAGVSGTVALTSAPLSITDSVELQGPGAANLTIDGSGLDRSGQPPLANVLRVEPAAAPITVMVSGVTVTGGASDWGAGIYIGDNSNVTVRDCVVTGNTSTFFGGGIGVYGQSSSTVSVVDSVVSNNSAQAFAGGIGFGSRGATSGGLVVVNSTVSGNSAGYIGGGVLMDGGLQSSITNSTISGNTAGAAGGGVYVYGYGYTYDVGGVTIRNSTISSNTATYYDGGGIATVEGGLSLDNSTVANNSAGGNGGGISTYQQALPAPLTIANSTVSGNQAGGGGGGIAAYSNDQISTSSGQIGNSVIASNTSADGADLAAGISTGGEGEPQRTPTAIPPFLLSYTLLQNPGTAAITDNGGNIFNQAAGLGALANNGGVTLTMLPQAGSPLIDAGDPAFAAGGTDQRGVGFPRVSNGRVDIGAVEVTVAAPPTTAAIPVPGLGLAGKLGLGALLGMLGLWLTRRRVTRSGRRA